MVSSDNCRMAPCGKPPHGEGRIVESRGNNIFLLGRNFSTMPILPGPACSPGAQPTGSLSTTEWSVGDPGRLSGLSLQGLLLRSLLLSFSSVCAGSSSCLAPRSSMSTPVPCSPIPLQQLSLFSSLHEQTDGKESSELLFLSHLSGCRSLCFWMAPGEPFTGLRF